MTDPATQTHDEDMLGKAYDRRLDAAPARVRPPVSRARVGALALLCVEGALQLVGPLLTQRVIDVALPRRDMRSWSYRRRCCSSYAGRASSCCTYGETMLTSLLGQRVMRDLRMQIFDAPAAAVDLVLRPESRRAARHARDVRRRIAERAVHRGRRRRARRPVHAARDQRRDVRHRLATRARGRSP